MGTGLQAAALHASDERPLIVGDLRRRSDRAGCPRPTPATFACRSADGPASVPLRPFLDGLAASHNRKTLNHVFLRVRQVRPWDAAWKTSLKCGASTRASRALRMLKSLHQSWSRSPAPTGNSAPAPTCEPCTGDGRTGRAADRSDRRGLCVGMREFDNDPGSALFPSRRGGPPIGDAIKRRLAKHVEAPAHECPTLR